MASNYQRTPYLVQQRKFPSESIQALTVQIDRAYIDIAEKVNSRTISIFGLKTPIITGEKWYITGQVTQQQTLRNLFTYTSAGSIPHDLNFANIDGFTKIYGTFTDGSNWYPLPYVDTVAATNQVNVIVTPTNIVITRGAGAPAITSGFVIIEWLSDF